MSRIAKMRRYAERVAEARERHEMQAWLASLSPEHRAFHDKAFPLVFCQECMRRAGEAFAAGLRLMTGTP